VRFIYGAGADRARGGLASRRSVEASDAPRAHQRPSPPRARGVDRRRPAHGMAARGLGGRGDRRGAARRGAQASASRATDGDDARHEYWSADLPGAIRAAPLREGLRRLHPELPMVMTTVTNTGAQIVRERFARLVTHRFFPLDLPWAVRRFAAAIDPAFLICMETELWPNTLRALAARGVPVMIANGRISDRSY